MIYPVLQPIEFGDAKPVAAGRSRLIFQHPANESWLVKVAREDRREAPAPWYQPWAGDRDKTAYRELKEYASLERKNLHDLPFIQRFYGQVETDYGTGMVVGKLRGKDSPLAPTVTKLVIENGLTDELRKLMLQLRDDVVEHNIIFSDVSGTNIVLAHDRHGERLVIIDGLGDRLWLPVNAMSAKINQMNRHRHFQRALEWLERSTVEGLKRGVIQPS